jgi:hypothetical protein
MNPTPVFVRYPPGGCGNYAALYLQSAWNAKMNITLAAHYDFRSNNSNFNDLRDIPGWMSSLSTDRSLVLQSLTQLKFHNDGTPFCFLPVHINDANVLLEYFSDSFLIDIIADNQDIPQLAYNWLIKNKNHPVLEQIQNFQIPNDAEKFVDLDLLICRKSVLIKSIIDQQTAVKPEHYHRVWSVTFNDVFNDLKAIWAKGILDFLGQSVHPVKQLAEMFVKQQMLVSTDVKLFVLDHLGTPCAKHHQV